MIYICLIREKWPKVINSHFEGVHKYNVASLPHLKWAKKIEQTIKRQKPFWRNGTLLELRWNWGELQHCGEEKTQIKCQRHDSFTNYFPRHFPVYPVLSQGVFKAQRQSQGEDLCSIPKIQKSCNSWLTRYKSTNTHSHRSNQRCSCRVLLLLTVT